MDLCKIERGRRRERGRCRLRGFGPYPPLGCTKQELLPLEPWTSWPYTFFGSALTFNYLPLMCVCGTATTFFVFTCLPRYLNNTGHQRCSCASYGFCKIFVGVVKRGGGELCLCLPVVLMALGTALVSGTTGTSARGWRDEDGTYVCMCIGVLYWGQKPWSA